MSFHGTLDGLVSAEKLSETKELFPKDTKFIEIDGGNHCSFGGYDFQKGDNESTITASEQQELVIKDMLEFLDTLKM